MESHISTYDGNKLDEQDSKRRPLHMSRTHQCRSHQTEILIVYVIILLGWKPQMETSQ